MTFEPLCRRLRRLRCDPFESFPILCAPVIHLVIVDVESLIESRILAQGKITDEGGSPVSVVPQNFSQRRRFLWKLISIPDHFRFVREISGQKATQRGVGFRGLGIGPSEQNAALCETINVGARIPMVPIDTEVIRPQRIDGYQNDVPRAFLRWLATITEKNARDDETK